MENLQTYLSGWRDLRYRRKDTFEINALFSAWDYFDGLWVQVYKSEDDGAARTLKFYKMPSVVRDVETLEWTFEDVGLDVVDIRVIPQRNLMVLMEAQEFVLSVYLDSVAH